MSNCVACGKKRPIFEVAPFRVVEGALLCPDCAKTKEAESPAIQARAAKAAGSSPFLVAGPIPMGILANDNRFKHGSLRTRPALFVL